MKWMLACCLSLSCAFGLSAEEKKPAWLGVSTSMVPPAVRAHVDLIPEAGLIVEAVIPGSPAAKVGLERFDILFKLGDQILMNTQQLDSLIRMSGVDAQVSLTIIRKGKERNIEVSLEERKHVNQLTLAFGVHQAVPLLGSHFKKTPEFTWPAPDLKSSQPTWITPECKSDELDFKVEWAPEQARQHVMVRAIDPSGMVTSDTAEGHLRTLVSRIVQSKGYSNWSDGEHQLTLKDLKGISHLVIKNLKTQKNVWEGAVGTAEQKAKIPEDLQKKFAQLERTTRLQSMNQEIIQLEEMIKVLEDGTTLRMMVTDPEQLKKWRKHIEIEVDGDVKIEKK